MHYLAASDRYNKMVFRRCGDSGLKLPMISLGLWHNFGDVDSKDTARKILLDAFDAGINHFDLANNYGPPPGSAESTFGKIFKSDLARYRDELIISTKAGYLMWPGPYGEWGSRKYLLSSLDQSLKRMDLDYVDIFYSHRYDPDTPLEETMGALTHAVKSGKALYAGISNYSPEHTLEAVRILKENKTPCIIHQVKFSLVQPEANEGLADILDKEGIGCIAFSPLGQGILTDRYINGIPSDSRAAKSHGFLRKEQLTSTVMNQVNELKHLSNKLGISLAELALNWVKSHNFVTSILLGVSSADQLKQDLGILHQDDFTEDIMNRIKTIMKN
ncbi:MAG: aldo/keto reductase [Bacteroidales bacterium]|nr:aldo/keto reductase [Bacteroidales bacterium]